MPISPLFLLLAAVIGLLVGLLVSSLFSPREHRSADTETIEPPSELEKEGYSKTVSLWYSPAGQKIITELDGEYYRAYPLLSAEQKSRVHKVLSLWSEWTEKVTDAKYEPVVIQKAQEVPETEVAKPELTPVLNWSVAEALKEEKEELAPPSGISKPTTIAGQISLILDRLLDGNPLKEKGIKLIENSHGGVDVWIGLEKYDGIDVIPHPEVQQLIRKAVALWEQESEMTRKI
jgi:hypothetical protein